MDGKTYIAIDLKSFYASVECVERGLNPMTTNLVVADKARTEKTICLAVSPSLKSYGIPGRARLFEVVQKVNEVNVRRRAHAPGRILTGASWDDNALKADLTLAVDYIIARPQMAHYMECSAAIYDVYLKYVAPEDIHVYSIDEVFMDVTDYLGRQTPRAFAEKIVRDVLKTTGITSTVGIGSNLYLCKIAMDIMAKHMPADDDGVRIAQIDEMSYRHTLWDHRPLTDFWRVGHGYAQKLEAHGMFTMGDVALCSVKNEALLYKLFGVNAELLIDHAWGWEPCTIADVKAYKPMSNSISSGQVLQHAYDFEKAKLVIREMADGLALELLDKGLVTDQMELTVGYDIENLHDPTRQKTYAGPVTTDHYGRRIPKHAHGSVNLGRYTASARVITDRVMELYDRIVDANLLVRRMYVVANHITEPGTAVREENTFEQLDLFADTAAERLRKEAEDAYFARELRRQQAVLDIKRKYGKNAILRGSSLLDGATARDRNKQIGGHRA